MATPDRDLDETMVGPGHASTSAPTPVDGIAADPSTKDPAAGAGAAKPSPLMERMRKRHVDTVATFQATMRQKSAAIDEQIFDHLRELRRSLTMDRQIADGKLDSLQADVDTHKTLLADNEERLASTPVGERMEPFQDNVHDSIQGRHGGHHAVLQSRRGKCEAARERIVGLGVELSTMHRARMERLTDTEARLRLWEHERRAVLKSLLEKLLEDLSSIAFVGITVSQLMVQRAALSVNEQLLANDTTARELLAQLRQHELLKHRESLKRLVALYGQYLHVLCHSIALWSRQTLRSDYFRDPEARTQQLTTTKLQVAQTKKDVSNLIEGLGLMIDTLSRKQSLDGPPTEVPGGCGDAGWLRFFNTQPRAVPVFDGSPDKLVAQWEVSVDVILRQVQHESSKALDAQQRAEDALCVDVGVLVETMRDDIEAVWTPTATERQLILQAAHDPDNVYPFDALTSDHDEDAAKASDAAGDAIQPIVDDVATEGTWFVESLALQFHFHNTRLMIALVGAQGGLIPVVRDATSMLYKVATQASTLVRGMFNQHVDTRRDYEDGLFRLEEAFQLCEDHLAHAGTVAMATDRFEEGMALLKKIEGLYCSHHESRTATVVPFLSELNTVFDSAMATAEDVMFVMPLAKAQAHNEALAAKAAVAREGAGAGAAGKGAAKTPQPGKMTKEQMEKDPQKSHLTTTRFDSLPMSKETARALREVFKYETMTKVQEVSLPIIQRGIDVCAKAKTGTGKTLGFLIPTIDVISKDPRRLDGGKDISALVLSPTRELASQIKVGVA